MNLLDVATQYCKEGTWKRLFLIKVCLLSFGIMIGILLPSMFASFVLKVCGILFVITALPLVYLLIRLLKRISKA